MVEEVLAGQPWLCFHMQINWVLRSAARLKLLPLKDLNHHANYENLSCAACLQFVCCLRDVSPFLDNARAPW